jgi:micrococcal nuclease
MNKKLVLLPLLASLFFACAPGHTEEDLPEAAAAVSPEYTVYVTNSGTKYHIEGCSSLRRSSIAATLAEAVRSGYEPCSICNPPELSAEPGPAGTAGELYRVNLAEPGRCEDVDFTRLVRAEVVDHVDGDTVRVRLQNPPGGLGLVETIRLIGVDTPETVHPRRDVEEFGVEASEYTKSRLFGKTVYLAFDWDLRDRYGRLLAYVYTDDKICHNAEIIRQGYGHAYTRFSFRFMDEFRGYEQEARNGKKGLWN